MGRAFLIAHLMEDGMKKIEIPLLGRHQINNAALALEALNTIRNYYCISEFQTEDGLRKTIWRGRIEILEKDPLVICDGAHNPDGAKKSVKFLTKIILLNKTINTI